MGRIPSKATDGSDEGRSDAGGCPARVTHRQPPTRSSPPHRREWRPGTTVRRRVESPDAAGLRPVDRGRARVLGADLEQWGGDLAERPAGHDHHGRPALVGRCRPATSGRAFLYTVRGWAIGLALAAVLAVPLGIALGLSDFAGRAFRCRSSSCAQFRPRRCPAAVPHPRHVARERGLPGDVRRLLAPAGTDDVRNPERRPGHTDTALVVRRAALQRLCRITLPTPSRTSRGPAASPRRWRSSSPSPPSSSWGRPGWVRSSTSRSLRVDHAGLRAGAGHRGARGLDVPRLRCARAARAPVASVAAGRGRMNSRTVTVSRSAPRSRYGDPRGLAALDARCGQPVLPATDQHPRRLPGAVALLPVGPT